MLIYKIGICSKEQATLLCWVRYGVQLNFKEQHYIILIFTLSFVGSKFRRALRSFNVKNILKNLNSYLDSIFVTKCVLTSVSSWSFRLLIIAGYDFAWDLNTLEFLTRQESNFESVNKLAGEDSRKPKCLLVLCRRNIVKNIQFNYQISVESLLLPTVL